jgi:hypothetical protein
VGGEIHFGYPALEEAINGEGATGVARIENRCIYHTAIVESPWATREAEVLGRRPKAERDVTPKALPIAKLVIAADPAMRNASSLLSALHAPGQQGP